MTGGFFHHHNVSPEEFEQIKAKIERQQMESEALAAEVENWIEGLAARETFLLAQLLIALYGNKAAQSSQIGILHGKLKYLYNYDPRTGEPFGANLSST